MNKQFNKKNIISGFALTMLVVVLLLGGCMKKTEVVKPKTFDIKELQPDNWQEAVAKIDELQDAVIKNKPLVNKIIAGLDVKDKRIVEVVWDRFWQTEDQAFQKALIQVLSLNETKKAVAVLRQFTFAKVHKDISLEALKVLVDNKSSFDLRQEEVKQLEKWITAKHGGTFPKRLLCQSYNLPENLNRKYCP